MEDLEIKSNSFIIRPIKRNKFSGQSAYDKTTTVIAGAQLSINGLYKTGLTNNDETHYEKNDLGMKGAR